MIKADERGIILRTSTYSYIRIAKERRLHNTLGSSSWAIAEKSRTNNADTRVLNRDLCSYQGASSEGVQYYSELKQRRDEQKYRLKPI